MKTIKLLGKTVTVDTDKLSKGLYDLHCEDEEKLTVLKFGMLDAKLCEIMETGIKKAILKEFTKDTQELFKSRILDFIRDCQKEVTTGVYGHAKNIMIV